MFSDARRLVELQARHAHASTAVSSYATFLPAVDLTIYATSLSTGHRPALRAGVIEMRKGLEVIARRRVPEGPGLPQVALHPAAAATEGGEEAVLHAVV